MKSKTIGIFVPSVFSVECREMLNAISKHAAEYGFNTMCFSSLTNLYNHDSYDKGEESIYLLAESVKLAGMVVFAEYIKDDEVNKRLVSHANKEGIPVFTVDKKIEGSYFVGYKYDVAFEIITNHVIEEHGARNIYMMSGIKDNIFSVTRNEAYRRSLENHGIPFDESKIYYGEYWESPTRKAVLQLLENCQELPDAIVCANDIMAITVCDVLRNMDIAVPDDIIVTGFDGIDRAHFNCPTITTAKYEFSEPARHIVDVIKSVYDGSPIESFDRYFNVVTVCGQSCGCKEISLKTLSNLSSSLYEEITRRKTFRQSMGLMNLLNNNDKSLREVLEDIGNYPSGVLYRGLAIFLDTSYFGESTDADNPCVLAAHVMPETLEYIVPFETIDLNDVGSHEFFKDFTNMLLVPLHCQERVYGYIIADYNYMDSESGERLSDFVFHLNILLAGVESAAKLKKTVNALNDMYIRDSLTNLLNRRGFYQQIDTLSVNAKKNTRNVMLVSIDLDGLKYINDTFGHTEGDYAITAVADIIADVVSDEGICARFGGDEYLAAIIENRLPEDIEREFKTALKKLNETSGKPYSIGASIGIEVISAFLTLEKIQEAITSADEKMFKQKRHSKISRTFRLASRI
jgi:diguanylate cyclase (GGDEF)-like protein